MYTHTHIYTYICTYLYMFTFERLKPFLLILKIWILTWNAVCKERPVKLRCVLFPLSSLLGYTVAQCAVFPRATHACRFSVALLTLGALLVWDGRWERRRNLASSLPEFSSFTGAAYIEQLKNKLLCEPSEAKEYCWVQKGIAFF